MGHIFWTVLCFGTITWYIVVTAIVAYKGSIDIKNMLSKMEDEKKNRS